MTNYLGCWSVRAGCWSLGAGHGNTSIDWMGGSTAGSSLNLPAVFVNFGLTNSLSLIGWGLLVAGVGVDSGGWAGSWYLTEPAGVLG